MASRVVTVGRSLDHENVVELAAILKAGPVETRPEVDGLAHGRVVLTDSDVLIRRKRLRPLQWPPLPRSWRSRKAAPTPARQIRARHLDHGLRESRIGPILANSNGLAADPFHG